MAVLISIFNCRYLKVNNYEYKKILVVDDELGIRELLRDILIDEGFEIFVAENATEARELKKVNA